MALKRRDVILCGIASFIAWGYAVHWAPSLRWASHAFLLGLAVPIVGLIALLLLTSKGSQYGDREGLHRRPGPVFVAPKEFQAEKEWLRSRKEYTPTPLYPESFIVSSALDDLLELIIRDFVKSWYCNISRDSVFTNEVDKAIRLALSNLRDRMLAVDMVEAVTTRFVPILTAHFKDFYDAERAIRGKHLNRSVTESEELDLAIASKYKEGKLHKAASLAYSDPKLVQQEYLRSLVEDLLPELLPSKDLQSRAVSVLIRELVACAVLSPIMQLVSDPDTWNQLMEAVGRSMLQDRSTVRKLRAALDQHASPAPKSGRTLPFPRLSPGDQERKFERFIRAIRKVNNLSDARRFRSEVSSQLKRDETKEGQDQVYLRRLNIGKRILDQRVQQLAAGAERRNSLPTVTIRDGTQTSALENASLVDILHDPSALSYFMEYMDRQNLMPIVQFWIVVDGFRNPLEDDMVEEDEIPSTLPPWTMADRADLAQINEAYLSRPELKVPESSRQLVRDFLKAGKDATPKQYFLARRAILQAQTAALESMQEKHFANFKRSDLFYKCLASQEATKSVQPPPAPVATSELVATPPKPLVLQRSLTPQPSSSKSNPISRVSNKFITRKGDIRRAAASSSDLTSSSGTLNDDMAASRRSLDDHTSSSSPLFDDDDVDSEAMVSSMYSVDQEPETVVPDKTVVQAMEEALNTIMEDKQDVELRGSLFGNDDIDSSNVSPNDDHSLRSSMDLKKAELFGREREKPSIASLGLVNTSSRIGVFTDDDLFGDEQKFIQDEHDDPEDDGQDEEDDIHEAAPGDLGLAEAIEALTTDIDRLVAQEAVVDSLTRKAELTNNTAELRILRKSKASLQREIRRKELQRQQYIVQESDNSLYGRSTIKIKSILVGKDDDGREYAIYVVEVQRKAGEQMPAATWTVTRRYSEFHELHQRLRVKYPSVRNLDFPRRRVVLKLQNDFLHKRRIGLENYLRELLLLPDVCRSRELRAFLSQSVVATGAHLFDPLDKKDIMTRLYNSVTDGVEDILGNIPVLDQLSVAGQSILSAATNQLMTMPPTIADDPISAAEAEAELNAFEDRELEPFVKPICDIFLEVFELNRGNNWLRGRAVVVVLHQLLGGTIERKVRENVKSFVQEDALLRYVEMLKDNMWPEGQLNKDRVPRTKNEKSKSRTEASLMLATLIPDLAASVVGRANAQAASRRIFATFNNQRLK
ncbi:PXA domain-containing protein [Xylogone sp. PMI_703]|nr:PXA domain-containing protein [Xylogone sp. PMI_703]